MARGSGSSATGSTRDDGTKVIARNAGLKPVIGPIDGEGRFTGSGVPGLTFERRWTTPGIHPYDEITWELRSAEIKNESGGTVFEQTDIEVPSFWSQLATNVVVSKYFRGHIGTPGRERSVKQLIDRVVNTIAGWAATQHYFKTDEDLATFKAELTHLLVHQKMAFNSPVWFNVGVVEKPQCSACQPYRALVSTPEGMVPIGQLVESGAVGREVYDAHGVTRIVAVKNNGFKPVHQIRLRNGNYVEATPDHVVKALREGRTQTEWLRVDQLEVGMRMHEHAHGSVVRERELVLAAVGGSSASSDDVRSSQAAQPVELEIVAIQELGVEEVYDIQTESGEYLTNNVAVHNCFINSVRDEMGSIMDLAKTEAMLFKYGSGAGVNLSTLRGSKEQLSRGGIASGPVSFMKGFDAFAGVVKCLTPDTYVVTGDGLLRIDEVMDTEGPEGFADSDSVTLNTPVGPRPISQVYRSPSAAIRSISLRTGLTLTGTHEHPVLTLTKEFGYAWTRLADLKPGARVAVERKRELWPDRAPLLADFQPRLKLRRRSLRYPIEVTPELARLLGYLVSEGAIDSERFRFSSADPEIMEDFCRCIETVFGVDCRRQITTRTHPATGVVTAQISLFWLGALQFFAFCGLGPDRSATKSVPHVIRRSPKSLVLEFLGAYTEGDGHVGDRQVSFASASPRLAEELQLLALNLGVVGRRTTIAGYPRLTYLGADAGHLARLLRPYLVTPRKRAAASALAQIESAKRNTNLDVIPGIIPVLKSLMVGGGNGYYLSTNGELIQTGFGIFNRRSENLSYDRAAGVPQFVDRLRDLDPALGTTLKKVLDDRYYWDEVVDVREAGHARTYDFTVPDVHAFVSNGIVSHNSGGTTRRAAKMVILDADHPDVVDFIDSKANEERKAWALIEQGYDPSFTGEAYGSVFFQNANHSVRVTDEFMRAVGSDGDWTTHEVKSGKPADTYKARELFRKMADAAWICGDPGIQYDTTINDWHTSAATDRIYASNPCSEYMFLNDTACNLASLNLMKFVGDDGEFDAEAFRFGCRITITAQEILVDNASYPTPQIELNSHKFRPLGIGYANLGALLMSRGLAYDSDDGRTYAAGITAIMTGESYRQSAEIARDHGGPFSEYALNEKPFIRVINKHRQAAYEISDRHAPAELVGAARRTWDEALELGTQFGYRNSQVSVLAPTGTIAFYMDCDTTGIEPDIALIKYKKLVGEGFLKIVNKTVPAALKKLGYNPTQVEDIVRYIDERETIEGAPELKPEHLSVFDCAFKPVNGERSIHYMGHVRMMGAAQPFLSGAISKTVNMPEAATPDDIADVYLEGWKLGLKAIAIYRDGSKRSQPLSTGKKKDKVAEETPHATDRAAAPIPLGLAGEPKPYRRRLPDERRAITHKFQVAGHEGYITVGLYPDGQPGEIFLKMAKEGSTVSGLMDSLATMTSIALQYGVPLRDVVNKFAHSRFEPAGFTGNQEIPIAKSIVDYVFRWMGSRFLSKDDRDALGIMTREDAGAGLPETVAGSATPPGGGLADASLAETPRPPTSPSSGATSSEPDPAHPSSSASSGDKTSGEAGGPKTTAVSTVTPPAETLARDTDLPVLSNGHSNGHTTDARPIKPIDLGGGTRVAFSVSADSPSCADCGSIMVRNGSCYKCLNCGSTSGCS